MKCFFLFIAGLISTTLFAQQDTAGKSQQNGLVLVRTIGENLADFTVDNLGNFYLLDKKGQLKKRSADGDSIAVYNDVRRYGKVHAIDASNPLKVLLYFRDFGTVVVLDRFLNNRNTIDLRKQDIFQARVIGQSFDNGLWVYDELNGKLKRLDDNGNLVAETVDFRVLSDAPPTPLYIADANRLVYLYDPEKGLIILDYFGTVRNQVALLGWTDFQVIGDDVVGRKGTMLLRYTPGTLMTKELLLPEPLHGVDKMQVVMDHLYCLKDGVLFVYSLQNQ
ncbi:hypothetical protein [Flavihumibacter sp. ZG627]|uniref:hypothetical protein n=1 Tax=Flavihumibacter sp. ZG627 TaxID=1463156 RepID=UPI00057F61BA|nr:hypothetical protein [Flavihumibacter sp. ZG627]KIC89686.1 hypothetical protein HY58_15050 [Flavihumibacter sp. ZG627]